MSFENIPLLFFYLFSHHYTCTPFHYVLRGDTCALSGRRPRQAGTTSTRVWSRVETEFGNVERCACEESDHWTRGTALEKSSRNFLDLTAMAAEEASA